MKQIQRRAVRGLMAALGMALVTSLTGCANFFVCDKASCTDGGGGGNTTAGNVAYVSNSSKGLTYINGYTLDKGTLAAATGSPYSLTYTPTAMVVTRNNKFLYVGSNDGIQSPNGTGVAAIYGYSIGTGGNLTIINGGTPIINAEVAAMDVSPDGKWLEVLLASDLSSLPTLNEFSIDSSTGALAAVQTAHYSGSTINSIVTPSGIKVAPSGNFIGIAMGTAGVYVFPFNAGAIGDPINGSGHVIPFSDTLVGALGIDIDSNNKIFVATRSGIMSYAVSAAGVPDNTILTTAKTDTTRPFSVLVDGTGFVYGGANNGTTSSVFGFTNTTGVLAPLTPPSTATSAGTVAALALDSTKKYVLAAGYGSTGLQMFTTDLAGGLTPVASAATGSNTAAPSAIALTH